MHSNTCFTSQEISSRNPQRILCVWCAAGCVCLCFENWSGQHFFLLSTSKLHKIEWSLKKNLLLVSSSDFLITPEPPKNQQRAWNLEPWLSLNQVIDKVILGFFINTVTKLKGRILCLSQAKCPLNKIFRIIYLNSKAFCIFFCLFNMKFLRNFQVFFWRHQYWLISHCQSAV